MITLPFNLDLYPSSVPTIVHVGQYDDDFSIVFKLVNSFGTFDLQTGTTAEIRGTKRDGNGYSADCTIDVQNKTVTVAGDAQMTAISGKNVFEIVLKKSDKVLTTANFVLDVEPAALDAGTITSESVLKELNAIIESASVATEAAADAEAAAELLENVSAEATTLEPGSDATASYEDGVFSFGIPGATAVTVDPTLTQEGQAADAKATGDAVDEVKSALSETNERINDVNSALTSRTENIFDYYSLIEGSYTDSSGNIVSRAGCYRTDYIPVEGGATYARYTPDATSSNYYYAFYDANKQFISRYNIRYSHTYEFPATAAYVIISSYDVTFQESFTIVKSNERIYYSTPYYKLKNKALYENFDETFTQSGMIADAKATGDKFGFIVIDTPNLYDYTKNEANKFYDASGNYTSDSGSYLSDFIPVESGEVYSYYGNSALYLNTFNSNKAWQARTKADGSSVTINSGISYVRLGMYKQNFVNGFMFVHGSMPDKDYPYPKMINPVLIPPEEETVDDGLIEVEGHTGYFYHYHQTKSGKYLRYKFNHFTNVSSNADGWVQRDVKLVNSLKSQELMKVVYDGEWEMAIQLHGAPDLIGCQNHGSEISTIINMYVNGIKTTISDGDSFSCKEIKVNQKSTMYDPTDETTIVGYHYKSHIITKNSIKIEQRIEWVRDVITDKSYVLMMPAIRGNDSVSTNQVTDHAYDNWNYEESDVATTAFNPSGIGSQKYRGNKFSLYGATSKISIESVCDIKERPESSFAYLSNASYYNKWYCSYCGDNFSVSNGDKWEWVSEYHITYDGN